MNSIDLDVLNHAAAWLRAGRSVTLVTVTQTWGSSPRPVGAMLALRDDGRVVGSVSGGCIEDDLIHRARERLRHRAVPQALPEAVTYGVSADEARRFGLPCGGTIQVVMEPLRSAQPIQELLVAVQAGRLVARELSLLTGHSLVRAALASELLRFDGQQLVTIHGPRYRLLIIGSGQLSQFLAQMATALDYQVTVCDPRAEYASAWDAAALPQVKLLHTMPDDTVIAMRPDARTAIVALTHDPKLDDLALMEALRSEAFYVGAIGSKLNSDKRRQRLQQFDLSAAQVARLHGPVGLYIGSRTPPEIAISILAHITAVKNGVLIAR